METTPYLLHRAALSIVTNELSPTPGESWAEALKTLGPDNTVEQGDVVVTEQNSKKLSTPRGADGKLLRPSVAPQQDTRSALGDAPGQADPTKRKVRTVGPTFLPSN